MNLPESISEYLTANGIKPSFQRIKIYEYIAFNKNHPTVNTIYNELVKLIPTLSKMTIYNTLRLFHAHKIISEIGIEDNELRYDTNILTHGHFKCNKCENIYDFNYKQSEISFLTIPDFKIDNTQLYLRGTCNNCNVTH